MLTSPDANKLRTALSSTNVSSIELAQVRAVTAVFHPLAELNLEEVMTLAASTPLTPVIADDIAQMQLAPMGYFGQSRVVQLSIDFSSRKKGAMKYAFFGTSTVPLALAAAMPTSTVGTVPVCAKCAFRTDGTLYAPNEQLTHLLMELRCLTWAHALMGLTYAFIDSFQQCDGTPSAIVVPRLRFVTAGLAIGQNTTKERGDVLILEDVIQTPFLKYINNGSAALPNVSRTESEHNTAEFLAFAQHVQFWKTKKLAFISDFQG